MRKMFKFELSTAGDEVYDSNLKISYIRLDGEEYEILAAEDDQGDMVYSTSEAFGGAKINKVLEVVSYRDQDDDFNFAIGNSVKQKEVGLLKSSKGYNYFPAKPNREEIQNLKDFIEKVEEVSDEVMKEMTVSRNETFYLGGE